MAEEKKTIYRKLMEARQEVLTRGVRKSGINMHAEFKYFELSDIVPLATEVFLKHGLIFIVSFSDDYGTGELVDIDNPEETIFVMSPLTKISEPGKFRMNEIQALGANITYMRRYLYFLILDLVEDDQIDAGAPSGGTAKKSKPPATQQERTAIKEELTAPEAKPDKMQLDALKKALKTLQELDPSSEEMIQRLVYETDRFKKLTKAECEALILKLGKKIDEYKEVEVSQ